MGSKILEIVETNVSVWKGLERFGKVNFPLTEWSQLLKDCICISSFTFGTAVIKW